MFPYQYCWESDPGDQGLPCGLMMSPRDLSVPGEKRKSNSKKVLTGVEMSGRKRGPGGLRGDYGKGIVVSRLAEPPSLNLDCLTAQPEAWPAAATALLAWPVRLSTACSLLQCCMGCAEVSIVCSVCYCLPHHLQKHCVWEVKVLPRRKTAQMGTVRLPFGLML